MATTSLNILRISIFYNEKQILPNLILVFGRIISSSIHQLYMDISCFFIYPLFLFLIRLTKKNPFVPSYQFLMYIYFFHQQSYFFFNSFNITSSQSIYSVLAPLSLSLDSDFFFVITLLLFLLSVMTWFIISLFLFFMEKDF